MGGGGNFFSGVANTIAQAVGDVVNGVSSAVGGSDHVMSTPSSQKADMEKAAQQAAAAEAAKMRDSQTQASAAEGGTPTAYASQQARSAAGTAASLSGSQQAVNNSSGSGTMLTGTQGVDTQRLNLGRQNLLGS